MGCPRSRKLELIADEKSRKVTFRKRRLGLAKKARELATLCGTDVLVAIVNDGDGLTTSATQIIFPDADVARILGRYRSAMKLIKKHPDPNAANHTAAPPIKKTDDDEAAMLSADGRRLREDLRAKIEEVTYRINTLSLLPNPQPLQDYGWLSLLMGTGTDMGASTSYRVVEAAEDEDEDVIRLLL